MAVPKRKTSTTRRDKRRTHWKLSMPALAKCSHCEHFIVPHRVCGNCGFYGGKEILNPES